MSQITQSQPMTLATESRQLMLPLTNQKLHSQIKPGAVWELLNNQQQDLLFQKLVLVCYNLVKRTAPTAIIEEVTNESI